ncbi:asparagine synthase (glutamine-hydrolyzing) [Flavihumibacter sp. R14]|nr:asparagine synthase (glutamine-hydrolyzing) [Flavihumibacter soli]
MCRIAGIISKHTDPHELSVRVKRMCDSMQHGGPDDEGVYLDAENHVCLGNRRLAIQDLTSAGHQPMQADNGKVWITFNGEIYNFKQLRAELKGLGAHFVTDTDTEVILKAYMQWGLASFGKLKGMFAFALCDHHIHKTFLVRDPGGIKPLYYSLQDSSLSFSSEVKAFAWSGLKLQEDENWKIWLLALGHIPEPYSTYQSVLSLPKGHYLAYSHQTASAELCRYFQYTYSSEINDPQAAVKRVQEAISHAVQQHLISDAEIGVFLSGGIDSSIITLLADGMQKERLNTLSIDLQETDYSEKKYQQLITERTSGRHREFRVGYKDFKDHFGQIIASMDQPSTDGINSWFVSKCAKENGLKAVLSGLGADEIFGGYPSFQRTGSVTALKKLPKSLLQAAEKNPAQKYKRLYYLSYDNPLGEYLFSRGVFTPQVIASILDTDTREIDRLLGNFPGDDAFSSLSKGNRASWLETNLYMQNQLLKDVDYMSMSHGIEVRVPFLDQDLMQLTNSISPDIKFRGNASKALLVDAFKFLLPEKTWNRPKMGFSFPFNEWMNKYEPIANPERYKNKTSADLIRRFNEGRLHWSSAFALYHIEEGGRWEG